MLHTYVIGKVWDGLVFSLYIQSLRFVYKLIIPCLMLVPVSKPMLEYLQATYCIYIHMQGYMILHRNDVLVEKVTIIL